MTVTIAALGTDGPPAKRSEGRYRFVCPHCQEMLTTVNPRNNLAQCFGCKKNLNNIDLLLTLGYDFKTAISILTRLHDTHTIALWGGCKCPFPRLGRTLVANLAELSSEDGRRKTCVIR